MKLDKRSRIENELELSDWKKDGNIFTKGNVKIILEDNLDYTICFTTLYRNTMVWDIFSHKNEIDIVNFNNAVSLIDFFKGEHNGKRDNY